MTLHVNFLRAIIFVALASAFSSASAQSDPSSGQKPPNGGTSPQTASKSQDDGQQPEPASKPSQAQQPANGQQSNTTYGQQTKRILGIFPNYRSVSANVTLPPDSVKEKYWLATQDSFDYSSFIYVALVAGFGQATNNVPQFHQGAAGYGRYYWHSFVDQAVGNYMTEATFPTLTHEDPRYYTLGTGGFVRRAKYAVSRLFITRTDKFNETFNLSEVLGNGAGAAISDLYYPKQQRTFSQTTQKWALQIGIDGIGNILQEFWPDINQHIFHGKY
ncbi:MAG TPA: hypothetical protein VI756_30075 [Blastocatellia bacterium]